MHIGFICWAPGSATEVQRQTELKMNRAAMVRERRARLLLAIRQTNQVHVVGYCQKSAS